jgi:hypothetical protein
MYLSTVLYLHICNEIIFLLTKKIRISELLQKDFGLDTEGFLTDYRAGPVNTYFAAQPAPLYLYLCI